MRCHRPLGSFVPFKLSNFCPHQAKKSERRSLSDTEPQAMFHGLAVSLAGQLGKGGRSILGIHCGMEEPTLCLGSAAQ